MNKPRRIRIYKLSTFDAFTDEEMVLHEAYKKAGKNKVVLKKIRDEKIKSYVGIRKIDRCRLYTYEYDENKEIISGSEEEDYNKQIELFESEMVRLANDFEEVFPLVKEIVYLKIAYQNEIFRQILDRGISIDDRKYIFYSSTTNQLKRGEVILIDEEFYVENETKFMCGLTPDIINSKGGCNRGKYLAYRGLPLSTSFLPEGFEIDIDRCLLIPDFETVVNENVEYIDIDHDKRIINAIKRLKMDVPIPPTDGAGMFLPGALPASAQIRCGHLKGAIFPFDFRKFLALDEVEGIKPNPIIKDAWGKVEHDIIKEDIQFLFTTSQLKLWGYYDSWDDFKIAFKENGMKIAINKFADTSPKGYVKSSYQFDQTLDSVKLTEQRIDEYCSDTLKYLDEMKTDKNKMIEIIYSEGNYFSDTLRVYPDLIFDKYAQNKLQDKFNSERTDARGNKLILNDSLYSYICPDLFAFCTWLFCGIENPKGIISKDHIYNSFFNNMGYEKVDCLRSPHLYIEHGIRNLVKSDVLERCKEWFNDFDTVVSNHDLLCRLLMFDVDGDEILLTPNKTLIECVPDDVVPLYYEAFAAEKSIITKDEIYNAVISSIENSNIGDISNNMTKNYNNSEIDMEFNKIMCCYNNLTIDYPKTQNNIELGKYQHKYNKLLKEQPPYFFRYAKGKKISMCKKIGNSNADRICKYIHKKTGNKKYEWKEGQDTFNPSILMNHTISVDIKDKKYLTLQSLLFTLKRKEQLLVRSVDEAIKAMSKSDGCAEKCARYDIFYHMCEKMILQIFDGDTREKATAYLLDLEYLQRENEDKGKNILWNCFGDVIYKNVCGNLNEVMLPTRRKHYETSGSSIRKIENKVVENIKAIPLQDVQITKADLDWIESLKYKRNCSNDRYLLYILIVLWKRNDGKVRIYSRKKNALTCTTIDKWIGDGVCICKRGLKRLEELGVIAIVNVSNEYTEITVNEPVFEKNELAFEVTQRNPMIQFFKYNGDRKVCECAICKRDFIKVGNSTTCSPVCSREQEKRRKNKQRKTA